MDRMPGARQRRFRSARGWELKVQTTLCHEIRQHHQIIVIDNVAKDPIYCGHHTPRVYGLQSYVSVPIILPNGRFVGTLCAIHSKTAHVNNPQTIGTFKLFAELIAYHLDASDKLDEARVNFWTSARCRSCANSSSPFWATICAARWQESMGHKLAFEGGLDGTFSTDSAHHEG